MREGMRIEIGSSPDLSTFRLSGSSVLVGFDFYSLARLFL